MLKQNIFNRITPILLALVVFISSTGFVSVQHFCNMSGYAKIVKTGCGCDDNCAGESTDNTVRNSSCCFEKTNYLINAVASFQFKTAIVFLHLPVLQNFIADVLPGLYSTAQTNFSTSQHSPPLLSGRLVLLQKNLLLI